ncbi:MAG: hypothetical protein ACO3FP_05120 [Burkholderiales bacterium]
MAQATSLGDMLKAKLAEKQLPSIHLGTLVIQMFTVIPRLDENGELYEDVLRTDDKMVTLLRKPSLTRDEARKIAFGYMEANQLKRIEVNARWIPEAECFFDGQIDL